MVLIRDRTFLKGGGGSTPAREVDPKGIEEEVGKARLLEVPPLLLLGLPPGMPLVEILQLARRPQGRWRSEGSGTQARVPEGALAGPLHHPTEGRLLGERRPPQIAA